jgi:hypothetical protein
MVLAMPRRLSVLILVVLAVGLCSGCPQARKAEVGSSPREPLDDLGQMLKSLADENRKPPRKLAELEEVEPMIPLAAPLLRSGELIYVWGAAYSPGGKKIVAYEKKAESSGGWVLLQDGTVQQMSVNEFASADKAK